MLSAVARSRNLAHRDALLAAGTSAIAAHGLAATTATIAKEAGVSAGTLFVHFESKPALVDQLYVALKTEMGAVAMDGLPLGATPREQLLHLWCQWVRWATGAPEPRSALAPESRRAVHRAFASTSELLERCRAGGPMQAVPLGFVLRVLTAIADATIDDLIQSPGTGPALADPRTSIGFDAIWRAIAG